MTIRGLATLALFPNATRMPTTNATPPTRIDARWRIAGLAFSLAMLAVHAVAGLHNAGVGDFWRDAYWATAVARGEAFPLAGPPIYGLVELGPWWFYLLAIPIGIVGRVAAAAVFVQLLAGAKYLIAYRLGARAIDARFGCLFAMSLGVAGWSTIPMLFPSHTAVVETALLLLAAATWRAWPRLSTSDAILFGLAAAACVHAHPTTASFVVVGGVALLIRHRSWPAFARLAIAAAIVFASLAPPWFDATPMRADRSVAGYVHADLASALVRRIPALVASALAGGAWNGFALMTKWSRAAVDGAFALWCVLALAALAGAVVLRRERPYRALLAGGVALFIGQAAFLCVLRPITPMWMMSSLLPPLAIVLTVGWTGAFERYGARIAVPMLAAFVVLSLAPFGLFVRDLTGVRVALGANPLHDAIDVTTAFGTVAVPHFAARRSDRLASSLCAPAVLHGRLAAIVESTLEVPERLACGDWPALRFGGTDRDAPHVAGVFARGVEAIGIAPSRVVAGLALYDRVTPIAPDLDATRARLARGQVYADGASDAVSLLVYEFETNGGDVPVLTDRFPGAAPFDIRRVLADGVPARVRFDDGGSIAYGCVACSADSRVRWRFELSGVAGNLDLVVIDAPRAP
jgi:hypothetical protein